MQVLSVAEFGRFCEEISPNCYVFSTDNQPWKTPKSPLKVVARYKIMVTTLHPNSICFKNESSCICFDRVKCVRVNPESCPVGTVFTIVCGDKNSALDDVLYTFIAD